MSLIHIHVSTCVDVPISIHHVTTQNKCYLNFKCTFNLGTITLLPAHDYKLIMFLDLHDSVKCKDIDVMISILHFPINNVYMSKVYMTMHHMCTFFSFLQTQ